MTLKRWFARSLPVSLMGLVMGGGAIALSITPGAAQLDLIEDTAPDRTLGTRVGPSNFPQVDFVSGGTRPQNGPNVFHSFQEFNVRENRGVYFESLPGVRNILTRVTGRDPSDILGTLGVSGTANLFLINPNGIIFGRNASLDLRGGSFYGTTASGIKFGEVGEFSAVNPQPPSSLLTINPSAFFFTSRERRGEIINQSQATQIVLPRTTSGLQVQNGQTLLLLGGDVTVDGGQLNAWGGRVEIGAIAGAGTVGLNPDGSVSVPAGLQRANVNFINRALVGVALDNSGDIGVTADNINVLNASVLTAGIRFGLGTLTSQAGDITLNATGLVQVVGQSSWIRNNVSQTATGNSGNLRILADVLEVKDGAQLQSITVGKGDAGNVIITARDRVLFSGTSAAFSRVEAGAEGKGGTVQIDTAVLEVLNGAALTASTLGRGDAGNVIITARDAVRVSGTEPGGRSSALFVFTFAGGQGGNITVNTRTLQVADGGVVDARTYTTGNSGNVVINARTVDLLNGGQLLAITQGSGRAGSITVNASERLTISGTDPTYATRLSQFGTRVAPVSESSGIFVRSQSSGESSGGAGDITVTTPQIRLNQGVINAESAAVDGGNINLNVGQLLLMRNGSLISATAGTKQKGGNGGNIIINAPDGFIVGVKSENSDIMANAFTGSGGRVNITAQRIFGLEFRPQLTEFSDITASSTFGASGVVTLNTPNVDPSRGLAQLPQSVIDTNRILANSCIMRDRATGGIFLITGTGGLPIRPGDPPLPVFPTGEVRGVEKAGEKFKIQNSKLMMLRSSKPKAFTDFPMGNSS